MMKSYSAILVVLIGIVLESVLAEDNIKEKTKQEIRSHATQQTSTVPEYIESNNLCGGVLSSISGTISYKNETFISPSERCIWIIKPNHATGFTLDVTYFGLPFYFSYYKTGVAATCFNRQGLTAFSSVNITQKGILNLPSTCHSLVKTYYSGSYTFSRGFSMSYTTIIRTNGASEGSKHHILTAPQEHVRHPANADEAYMNNELTMFGFGIPRSDYSARKTLVTYMSDTIGGSCADRIHMYRFATISGWVSVSSFCSDVEFEQWKDTEIMLLTFTCDGSGIDTGFHITRTDYPFYA